MLSQHTLTERVSSIEATLKNLGVEQVSGCESDIVGKTDYARAQAEKQYYADQQTRAVEPGPTAAQTAFEEITFRIQQATDRVRFLASRVEEIGTRTMGSLPENDEGKSGVSISPDGTLDHTLMALNWLDSALGRAHGAVTRIERL